MAILVLSAPLASAPFVDALRRAAPDLTIWSDADEAPAESVEAILAWRMGDGVLPRYRNLRVLCSTGAGVDKLLAIGDLPDAVHVTRMVDPMQGLQIAQYVVAQTLRFTRDLPLYTEQQSRGYWKRHRVRPFERCRVGLLGLGRIGGAIAAAFAPLGYPLAAWTRRGHQVPGVANYVGDASLDDFLKQSNILVCALALTPHTRGILCRRTLEKLPAGAFVINVGRGEHVVEAELRALLDEGHLHGAALDVFEREPPPPDNWVWSHPRVVATPHIAGEASFDEVAQQCVDSLLRARRGERPLNTVDRAAGY